MNKQQLMSIVLGRADLVESSVKALEEKLIQLASYYHSEETRHVIHESRMLVEEIQVRLVRFFPYLKSLQRAVEKDKCEEIPA